MQKDTGTCIIIRVSHTYKATEIFAAITMLKREAKKNMSLGSLRSRGYYIDLLPLSKPSSLVLDGIFAYILCSHHVLPIVNRTKLDKVTLILNFEYFVLELLVAINKSWLWN